MKVLPLLFLLLFHFPARAQTQLTGRVLDAQNQPVPYATVAVLTTPYGTTADARGAFELRNLPAGPARVRVSAVGFVAQEQALTLAAGVAQTLTFRLVADAATLADVVVTGVSRGTQIRRSPVPIAALSRREMQLNPGGNVIDAAVRGLPGLTAVTTGPNISKPFIRGLGYNRVLTLYDGVRQEGQQWGDEHGVEVDGYGVARVEVVKGPASLLYGSDALAGVVNLLPAPAPAGPPGRLGGEVLTEYQSNNGLIGNSLALSYNQGGWHYAARASHRSAHNYQNPVDGYVFGTSFRELNLSSTVGVVRARGRSALTLTLYDNHQEIPDGSRDSLSRRFTRQVADGALDDIRRRPLVSDAALRGYGIGPLYQRIQHYRAFSKSSWRLGGGGADGAGGEHGEVQLLLGVQHNHRREFIYPTAPAQAALDMRLTTFNYDLRYLAPAWRGLDITLGVNGMGQLNRHGPATEFAIPRYGLFDLGGFAVAKRALGPVEVSGGLRLDARRVSWPDFYVAPNPATGFEGAATPDAPGARQQFAAFGRRYAGLSASLGAAWLASERLTLRANLARGYRAPNIPEIGSNGLDPGARIVYLGNRAFEPEFSLQQDVGVVWHGSRLEISLEGFHNQVSNFIYQGRLTDAAGQPVVDAAGNLTYQFRQAGARLYGFEAALTGRPAALPWLQASTSLALVHGRNEDDKLLRENGPGARFLPLIPPPQARFELRATRAAGANNRLRNSYLRLTAELTATQNRFFAVDDTETRTPGYGLLGAGAGTTLVSPAGREVLQVFVQADNLLNQAYQSHLSRLKYFELYRASPTGRLGIFNAGRNVSLKVVVPIGN